jgi:glycosyltransferase involved in cell wall biosynthesis
MASAGKKATFTGRAGSALAEPEREDVGRQRHPSRSAVSPAARKRVLLISNRVMHYRVSVYNYFWRRFAEHDWNFSVVANELQRRNQDHPSFEFTELPFSFAGYRRAIQTTKPDGVILFLHLKDRIFWPLLHWLKLARIPLALWTKTRNLDRPDDRIRNALFHYSHHLSDALILYADGLVRYVAPRNRHKVFIANNTLNFEDFPDISESKASIKRSLGIPFEKVVLFSGRVGEEHNRKKVDHLIDIFRELHRTDIGLVIVGSGLGEELRARMNPGNTRYLGEVHDPQNIQISRIFKMADVCSIPGHVGLGLNHAFFWGLPLVTEDGKQPPEIDYLCDGRNGFIVPENDVRALRERILFLIDNDAERLRFSANARHDILTRASVEGMFQGFLGCSEYLRSLSDSRRTVL